MAGGRPTKYKKKYCKALIDHMAEGLSFQSFAGVLGVCRDTLYEWEKQHKEFSYTKKVGDQMSLLQWEKWGIDGLFTESETVIEGKTKTTRTKSMNAAVYCFNMKNRHNWSDNPGGMEASGTFTFSKKKKD